VLRSRSRATTVWVGVVLALVAGFIALISTGAKMWHGWAWHFWDPLVAIGTLVLAIATIYLARETAAEIRESHTARRQDIERARIDRIVVEVLNLVAVAHRRVSGAGGSTVEPVELEIAKQRLNAAIALGGGPGRWHQTDLLTRDTAAADTIPPQTKSAIVEINQALDALEGRNPPR
jgi:hypothetical protein